MADNRSYWTRVKEAAAALKGDGCTSAPDLNYRKCCDEHDVHYRTHMTVDGKPITRSQADKKMRKCMNKTGVTPLLGTHFLPVVYWIGVRLFGGKAWRKGDDRGADKT